MLVEALGIYSDLAETQAGKMQDGVEWGRRSCSPKKSLGLAGTLNPGRRDRT